MKSDIVGAKRELYNQLKELEEVTGAGIREKKGMEQIVIFLTKRNKKVLDRIPSEFKGNQVVTEVRSVARAM